MEYKVVEACARFANQKIEPKKRQVERIHQPLKGLTFRELT